jgi:hypothetical protein
LPFAHTERYRAFQRSGIEQELRSCCEAAEKELRGNKRAGKKRDRDKKENGNVTVPFLGVAEDDE